MGLSVPFATAAQNAAGTARGAALDPAGVREAFNAGGSAPVYACRAWVNFNGSGVVAIRGSGNVSSITDNAVGDYTVNFATALPNSNYVAVLASAGNRNASDQMLCNVATNGNANVTAPELYSTAQLRVRTGNTAATFTGVDTTFLGVSIFC